MGQSPPSSTYNETGVGLPFFQGKSEFTDLHPVPKKWCSEPKKIAQENDILMSVRAPVGATNMANQECCIGRGLAAIRYPDCPKYLLYFLRSIENELDNLGTGTTFKAISAGTLRNLEIPLPPLPEQHRIVEKIEELFSELDNGIENLKKSKAQIKTYRQAVLKSAFEGKLTQDKRTKIKDKSGDGELPEGWEFETVNDISEKIVDCLHSTPKFKESGKYCVDTTCIKNGQILFDKIRFVSEETYNDRIRRLKPKQGDILFAREGTVGTALIVPREIELCLGQRMMMFRPRKDILSKYFMYSLQSPQFVKQYKPLIGGTTAPHLNIRDIKKFQIPVCSTQQQTQIVEEIERRFSVADKMEVAIDESLKKSEALRQSILKQAFEGKLV